MVLTGLEMSGPKSIALDYKCQILCQMLEFSQCQRAFSVSYAISLQIYKAWFASGRWTDLMPSNASGAERGVGELILFGPWARSFRSPSAKAKQTFRRRSSDYFLWWINPLDRLILVYFGPRPRTLSLSSWNKGFETPLLSLCWAESQRVFEPSAVCQFFFELPNLWCVPAGFKPVNKR